MAIYHLSVQTISRGQGKSCVAAAAYRAGEKLYDEKQELNHNYTKKQEIESEIIAPSNAPEWVKDREKLWNEVDKAETRCNSRTAREINIALPLELSKDQQKELVREYVKDNFVNKGMVADVCFHFNDSNNPHCHVMLTTREISQDGFTKKNREWDKKEMVEEWREQWSNHANKALEKANCEQRIDHRSYKEQGIDQLPTVHLGKTSSEMQKKGIKNKRAELNNQIKELNKQKVIALQEYKELKAKLDKEKAQETKEAQRYTYMYPKEKAYVQAAEKVIKQPLDYANAAKALDALKDMKEKKVTNLSNLNFQAKELQAKLSNIDRGVEGVRRSENELKNLDKNMFGQYKDKQRADILKSNIEIFKRDLIELGYRGSADISIGKRKLEDIQKNIDEAKKYITSVDERTECIRHAVKALQNKELREFFKEYEKHFPHAKYLTYEDMKTIKDVNERFGRMASVQEIRAMRYNYGSRIDEINSELTKIEANSKRISEAKQAMATIDKYKDIADKWESKIFGKAKFQQEFAWEKQEFDNATAKLKKLGVNSVADLRIQESSHERNVRNIKPKLEVERTRITPAFNMVSAALRALGNAQQSAEHEQQHERDDLKIKKTFRDRDNEMEL